MNIILFGFKGAGKTHFGRLLALKIHRPFIDTDDLILELYAKEAGQRKKAKQIYAELGKVAFRDLEKRAVQTLKGVENSVIAVGGGTVVDPENVAVLQKVGALVYLKAGSETIKKRIFKEELPAFFDKNDPEGSFLAMVHEREPIYRSIAARVVDVDLLDEAGVLAALSSILLLEEPPNGF
ncbi:MAG TPA: shikimate kinase [Chlamydiales bacterium]|nr:shikimate kinase [Chlamydiales bacterium]